MENDLCRRDGIRIEALPLQDVGEAIVQAMVLARRSALAKHHVNRLDTAAAFIDRPLG